MLEASEQVKLTILSAYDLDQPYTKNYAKDIYNELVCRLKGQGRAARETLLAETKLIILFMHKPDDSHAVLFDRFGVEAFVTPLMLLGVSDLPLKTRGQRGRVVNELIRDARSAIRHAIPMLDAIYEELNGRDNKTCLLLPPKTFGKDFRKVLYRVWGAAANRDEDPASFVRSLKNLKIARRDKYYEGERRLVFKAPSKAGPRHGLPPVWKDRHESSCVIRGRLRFGVSYDPSFHYDCPIPSGSHREFPGCHKPVKLPSDRPHVNCAPNDGIR